MAHQFVSVEVKMEQEAICEAGGGRTAGYTLQEHSRGRHKIGVLHLP